MYDIIVVGGGTAGVPAAVAAARQNAKVLIIEKNSFLGGTATGALVTPMMGTILPNDFKTNLSQGGLYSEIIERLEKLHAAGTHENGNPGWFDPEIMKCVLDDMATEAGCHILFNAYLMSCQIKDNLIQSVQIVTKSGVQNLEAQEFIDASGDADLAYYAGVPFELGNESGEFQAFSLRFIMGNVDTKRLVAWLNEIDPNSPVSSISGELITTAHTWHGDLWKLRPIFEQGVLEGVIDQETASYFQLFSIPGRKGSIAFNCPRIFRDTNLNPLLDQDLTYTYVQGRKQVRILANFVKKYIPGFEEAYISNIATNAGIRDSRRIRGEYYLTEEDILNCQKFDDAVANSNYPIDVHSDNEKKSRLEHIKQGGYYQIPLRSLKPVGIKNLLVAGRCISASWLAQAAIRIQPTCWKMGEAVGYESAQRIKAL